MEHRDLSRGGALWGTSLMTLNTVLGAGFGFIFWIVAARSLSVETIGVGATEIALLSLLGFVGRAGADVVILKHRRGRGTNPVERMGLFIALGTTVLVSLLSLSLFPPAFRGAVGFPDIASPAAGWLVAGAAAFAAITTFDALFLGRREFGSMTIQALLWGLGRLSGLFIFSGPHALLAAWAGGTILAASGSAVLSGLLRSSQQREPYRKRLTLWATWRLSIVLHVGTIGMVAPLLAYRPMMLAGASAESAALFQVAATVAIVPMSFARALGLNALASTEDRPLTQIRSAAAIWPLAVLYLLATVGTAIAGPVVLPVFGEAYGAALVAAVFLVAAGFPSALGHLALARTRRSPYPLVGSIIALVGGTITVMMGLALLQMWERSASAAAVGYLMGQLVTATLLVMLLRWKPMQGSLEHLTPERASL